MANDYIGLHKEATFGVKPVLANTEWIDALGETLRATRAYENEIGMFFNVKRATDVVSGRYSTAGAIRWQMGPENGIGKVLESMFGAPASADVGVPAGAIEHTWNDNNPAMSPRSMSVFLSRSYQTQLLTYLGQTASRLSIEAVPNQSIRCEAEWMGDFEQSEVVAETPSVPTQEVFVAHETDWKTEPSGGGAVASELRVEGWSLEVAREIEIPPSVSQIRGRRNYGAEYSITGRADIDFDTLLYYKRALYGNDTATTPADEVTLRNITIEIVGDQTAEASHFYQLLVDMPLCVIETAEVNQSGRDRITGGFPFRAYFDTVSGYAVRFRLKNTRALTFYA